MQLKSLHIEHFRALRNCVIAFSDNTALVGQNGAGKSSVLQAIQFYFDTVATASEEDQSHGSTEPLAVTATLDELTPSEAEIYAQFLGADNSLTVTKRCLPGEPSRFTVRGRRFEGFDSLRALEHERPSVFTPAYKEFVDTNPDFDLAKPRSADDCKAELIRWERENPDRLKEADVPFTFAGASRAQLIPTTRLIYVPAVHDASDDFHGGKSPLGQMIDALVTTQLEQKPAIISLQEKWDAEYQQVLLENGTTELDDLAARLSSVVGELVPGAAVAFSWREEHPSVPIPSVLSQIKEDGIPTEIGHQGHGMQRALIMALLQAFDEHARSRDWSDGSDVTQSHILLLIEEPELYQHPPRARHISRVLRKLATEPTSTAAFRIILTTHSPNFVSIDDLESVRIVRKESAGEGVPSRKISALLLQQICDLVAWASGNPPQTIPELARSLHVLDGALREAFFANCVVLTEGVGDVGVLNEVCARTGVDLEAKGTVVTSISGRTQIPIAIAILKLLGIPHYVVFDADNEAQLAATQTILKLLGAAEADIPLVGTPTTIVRDTYAIMSRKMEDVLRAEFGEAAFNEAIDETTRLYGRRDITKNPVTSAFLIKTLYERGLRSTTLDSIVNRLALFPFVGNTTLPKPKTSFTEKRKPK